MKISFFTIWVNCPFERINLMYYCYSTLTPNLNSYLNHITWQNDPTPPCSSPHYRAGSCTRGGMGLGDRSHYTWVLTGWKGSAVLSGLRGNRGGDGSGRRSGEEEWSSFHRALTWVTAAQLWHWWCIPAHREGWKNYHRNVMERPSTHNSVYPSFKLQNRFYHLVKLT